MLYMVFTQQNIINTSLDQYVYFQSNSKAAVACGWLTDMIC